MPGALISSSVLSKYFAMPKLCAVSLARSVCLLQIPAISYCGSSCRAGMWPYRVQLPDPRIPTRMRLLVGIGKMRRSLLPQRSHVDDEAILHVAFQHTAESGLGMPYGDDLYLGAQSFVRAEIEHFLRFLDATD